MAWFVKNTTKIGWVDLICPHYCKGCGRLGEVFCGCCKKDLKKQKGIKSLKLLDEKLFAVGWRRGILARLVADYKYHSVRSLGEVLVGLLDEVLPCWENVVVVPLPTIMKHVRQRGLDHTLIMARKLAKRRGWAVERILERRKNTVQVGATAEERARQAAEAYSLNGKIQKDTIYLLLDDVWTTGASMRAAKEILEKAGAREIKMAVIAVSGET